MMGFTLPEQGELCIQSINPLTTSVFVNLSFMDTFSIQPSNHPTIQPYNSPLAFACCNTMGGITQEGSAAAVGSVARLPPLPSVPVTSMLSSMEMGLRTLQICPNNNIASATPTKTPQDDHVADLEAEGDGIEKIGMAYIKTPAQIP